MIKKIFHIFFWVALVTAWFIPSSFISGKYQKIKIKNIFNLALIATVLTLASCGDETDSTDEVEEVFEVDKDQFLNQGKNTVHKLHKFFKINDKKNSFYSFNFSEYLYICSIL